MSLTSFLKDKEVKALFSDSFKKPRGKIAGEIKTPVLTKKYALVCTAFDYLMRFHLKYHNPDASVKPWVAEGACILMKNYEPDDVWINAVRELQFSKDSYLKFLNDGVLTDDILKSSMLLAHLDVYFRAGRDAYNITMEINDNDIQDLKNLINLVDFDKFEAKSHCLLNPTFNEASRLVHGADADIVVDSKLIDIKTTKNLAVTRDIFNQIIGYYILGKIGGIGEQRLDGSTIEKIGFYFSRYGILHLYNVEDIIDFEKLPDIMNKFETMAKEIFTDKKPKAG